MKVTLGTWMMEDTLCVGFCRPCRASSPRTSCAMLVAMIEASTGRAAAADRLVITSSSTVRSMSSFERLCGRRQATDEPVVVR